MNTTLLVAVSTIFLCGLVLSYLAHRARRKRSGS